MQPIQTKGQVKEDKTLTLTVQLPEEVQAGEYEVVLVLNSSAPTSKPTASLSAEEEQRRLNKVWKELMEEVEDLPISPTPVSSEYQQDLVEKYRKQGLEL